MASDSFLVKVLTPAGVVFEERATSVTLPSTEGELGFLPGHTRYTGILGTGILRLSPVTGGEERRIVVSGGFVNFNDDVMNILADTVDLKETIDRSKLTKLHDDAQHVLDATDGYSDQWQVAHDKLARVDAMQELIN